jgi:hypothetical protein
MMNIHALGIAGWLVAASVLFGAVPARGQDMEMGNILMEGQDSSDHADQQDPSEITKLTLSLFSAAVAPKAPIYINATLANPQNASVQELRSTIKFPNDKLTFVRARLGIAADLANSKLDLQMQDASGAAVTEPEKASTLIMKVTADKPIPAGPIAEFQFRQTQEKEETVHVTHVAEARDKDGKALPEFVFSEVDVRITKNLGPQPLAVFSCFFYMH